MQGRLSPLVGDRIQAFPWPSWREEFPIAERHGFRLMEWTLDQDRLHENPLLTPDGQAGIRALSRAHGLSIPSLTGDCFMQAPFWKSPDAARDGLERDFLAVADACAAAGDLDCRGAARRPRPARHAGAGRQAGGDAAAARHAPDRSGSPRAVRVRFRAGTSCAASSTASIPRCSASTTTPATAPRWDSTRPPSSPPTDTASGTCTSRIALLGGTTVPLGAGAADFDTVFAQLARLGYQGNFILQTARAADGDHAGVLSRYRDGRRSHDGSPCSLSSQARPRWSPGPHAASAAPSPKCCTAKGAGWR